jgi:hypothetical protein
MNLSAEVEALLQVGMCFDLSGGGNSETVCIASLAPVQFVNPTQFAYPAGSMLTLLEGAYSSSNTSMVITCGPVEAGAMSINLSAEVEALMQVGMCFTLAGGGTSETVCIASLGPVQLVSPTQFAYPAGSTITLLEGVFSDGTTLIISCGPIAAGATSIEVSSEVQALLSAGMCFTLAGGGNSETVCIAGFGSILLVNPTVFAYPAGSTLTLLDGVSPSSSSTTAENQATVHDDPHVCALDGECFDIRAPSEYTLLRVPVSAQEPPALKLSGVLDTDGVRPCGLFVKHLTLSGSLLNNQIMRIRPYTRNTGGSNWVGSTAVSNFSLQLGNSSWRSFTHTDSLRQIAVVGQLTVAFVWREQYGQRMEAQSFELSVGGSGHSAVITVSQASHQALNLDMSGMSRLGYSRMGGVLGTEGHLASIEEPTLECMAATASSNSEDSDFLHRQQPMLSLPERASTVRVSWD